ncbi:hypothetical protein D3C81_1221870 [compost metagenome]
MIQLNLARADIVHQPQLAANIQLLKRVHVGECCGINEGGERVSITNTVCVEPGACTRIIEGCHGAVPLDFVERLDEIV